MAHLPVYAMASVLAALLTQSGWALAGAKPREVGRTYWELIPEMEVWLRLVPEDPEGKPPLGRAKRERVLFATAPAAGKVGTVSANGLSFAYVDEGSGTPVVLIHGSVSDYREWSKQMASLARHHRVIAYSRRYHWPNLPPGKDADASVEQQADDLAAIIQVAGIAPAHLVGHSFGGAIALNLTLRHPELVRTLVLAEPAVSGVLPDTPENDVVSKESQAIRAEMKDAFASGNAERIARTYAAHVAPGEFEKASPEIQEMLFANVTAFQLDFTSRRPPFTCDDARRVAVPVLVISGERSPLGLQRIAEETARCMKAARLVRIPEATHWLQSDHAQAFNDAVLAFLDGRGR
jgi:pimeloyl-ACP methyl ester carboxylesterase